MPTRRKSRNPLSSLSSRRASSPEKENSAAAIPHHHQPLSPRLVRCRSDNTQRTFCELNSTSSKLHNGVLSAEEKMSNLVQLNSSLVKEVSALRLSERDLTAKVHHQEELLLTGQSLLQEKHGLQEENSRLLLQMASLREDLDMCGSENASLLAEKRDLIASNTELRGSLTASRCREKEQSHNLETSQRDMGLLFEAQKNATASVEDQLRTELLAKESLHIQNTELVEELACCKKEADALEFERNKLLAEKQAMQAHMGEIVKEVEGERKVASEAKEQTGKEMESLEKLLEEQKVENEEAKRLHYAEITQLTRINDSLRSQNQMRTEEVVELRDNSSRLSDMCDTLSQTMKEKSEMLLEEQKSRSAARECVLAMEDQMEKLRILNLKLAQEVASKRRENEQLGKQTSTMLSEKECLLVEKERLEGTVSSLIRKHHDLEGSFSSLTAKHEDLNKLLCSEADRFQELIYSLQTEKEAAQEAHGYTSGR